MMAGQPQSARERGETTGAALAKVYPPDAAAEATLDRLIEQLEQVPWPKPKEAKQ